MQKQNAELVAAAGKAPSWLWKAFKAVQLDTCPVELTAQFQASRALTSTLPEQDTKELSASGVFASCSLDGECLSVDVTADELHTCIKHLKHGKSSDIDSTSGNDQDRW